MFDDPTFREDLLQKRTIESLAESKNVSVVRSWGKGVWRFAIASFAVSAIASLCYSSIGVASVKPATPDTSITAGTLITPEDIEDEIDLQLALEALKEPGSVTWKEVKEHLQLP